MKLHLATAWTTLLGIGAGGALAASLAGCIGDDSSATPSTDASTSDSSRSPDAGAPSSDASHDVSTGAEAGAGTGNGDAREASADSGLVSPTFLVHFNLGQMQQPEGLWEVAATDGGAPLTVVGFAPLATLVTVKSDGTTQPFASLGAASNTFTLGITSDSAGSVYVGVGAAGASPTPALGIYKIPSGGGSSTLFSAGAAVTPAMNFPNGLDFVGSDLFVADSGGTIYKIPPSGVATVWLTDPSLAPDISACGGFPFALGANGIVHDATSFYVANTNFGRLVKIPIQNDGTAGTPSVIVETCELQGADGLAFDTTSNSILLAVNFPNRIERISLTGQRTTLASGAPLDAPASLFIESTSSGRRLLITNASFFSADAGQPGLLSMPLP